MLRNIKQYFNRIRNHNSSLKYIILTENKINFKDKFKKFIFFSLSNIIKMDILNNNSDQPENQSEEENPTTFDKLKNLLDEKQVKYTLLEVNKLILIKNNCDF